MRAALACFVLLPLLASGTHADLGDVDTALAEISFEEVQVSPDGSRLAFIARHNDFEKDREASEIWRLDLTGSAAGEAARRVEVGWTDDELYDALNVALVVGGSIVIPHLRHAFDTIDQLRAEKADKEK